VAGETPEIEPTTTTPQTTPPTGVSWAVFTGPQTGTRCDMINVGGGLLVATQPNGVLLGVAEFDNAGRPFNVADTPLPAFVDQESFILDAEGTEIGYVGGVVDANGVERMFALDLDDVVINSEVTADALAAADLSILPCGPACSFVENANPAMCR
jgi:hypothetical protein